MGVGGAHIWAWAGSLSAPAGRPARTQRGFEVRRLNAADFTRFTRALYVEGLYVSLGRRSYRLGSVNNGGQWGRADKCCVHAGCETLRYEPRSGVYSGRLCGPQGPNLKHSISWKLDKVYQ